MSVGRSNSPQRCRDRGNRAGRGRLDHPRSRTDGFCRRAESSACGLSRRKSDRGPGHLGKGEPCRARRISGEGADCKVCHTTPGGKEFAGGFGFKLPFGTLYSTNITPDKETGIGNYSDQDFLNAVHRGIRRDGARLYPAMSYPSYTYMTDDDALAIKAYLFSLPPVRAPLQTIR